MSEEYQQLNTASKYLCPSCGRKLITIDLQIAKQLYCAACTVKPCRNGATANSFDEAMLKIDQSYEQYIKSLGDSSPSDAVSDADQTLPEPS